MGFSRSSGHMGIADHQELQVAGIIADIFTEDQQGFDPFHGFCSGFDSQVYQTLRIVFSLDLQDSVPRFTDMSGNQGNIGNESSLPLR